MYMYFISFDTADKVKIKLVADQNTANELCK